MGLRVRTNISSLIAQRNFNASSEEVQKSIDKVSSGYRINKAADDAAGLAISEVLRADIRSLDQARRNANDAVSLVQVSEGGLEEINSIMIRLRELSVQAASDTIGARERTYLNQEYMALKNEVDRIAISTEFNGTRLLTGQKELHASLLEDHNYSPLEIQVGKDYLPIPDSKDAANPINVMRMDLGNFNATTEGENSLNIGSAQNPDGTSVNTKEQAQGAISQLDDAMQQIAQYRAALGALQNRLQSTDRNLTVQVENLSAAKSRIKDLDFASETANIAQHSILQQAGASVLTQANQLPGIVLKLLQ